MRFDGNGGSAPNDEPAWAPGNALADRCSHRVEDDHYPQLRSLFHLTNAE